MSWRAVESRSDAQGRSGESATQVPLVLQQVDRILESAEFSGSRRCQDFLRHIVDRALAGQLDCLKERVIGIALFGRSPDYDTGSDACVRVIAGETRKRLQRYYSRGSHAAETSIHLPLGSYLPTFHVAGVASSSQPDDATPETRHHPDWLPAAFAPGLRRSLKGGLAVLTAVVAGLCLLLYSQNLSLRQQIRRGASPAAIDSPPWSALFAGNRSVHLILGDGSIGAVQVRLKKRVSLTDYLNKRFMPEPGSVSGEEAGFLQFLVQSEFTTVSYAATAVRIAQLAQSHPYPLSVSFAREMSLRTVRGGDSFIFIGTARANPWIELFEQHLNFSLHYDARKREPVFRNKAAQPGEPASYVPIGGSADARRQSYGHVAFLPFVNQSGHVLLVGGTSSQATEATGDFITDVARLRDVLGRMGLAPGDPPRRFEILLKVTHTTGAPVHCESVGHRVVADLSYR